MKVRCCQKHFSTLSLPADQLNNSWKKANIFAIKAKRGGQVESPLQANPNPSLCSAKSPDGRTPLLLAAIFGNKEVAEMAMADCAEVKVKPEAGWKPGLRTKAVRIVSANHESAEFWRHA